MKQPYTGLWRWFALPFAVRVFALYFVFVGLSGFFMLDLVVKEIKPAVRQSSEEVLFDTAQLLAALVATELSPQSQKQQQLQLSASTAQLLQSYGQHRTQASIWGIAKASVPHRIYITNHLGIVIYDSTGADLGKDYSRWNDVYLTLKGQYGARSSKADPSDDNSTVMHVAAAVRTQNQLLGVLTIAKPNHSMQPFIDRTQAYLTQRGLLLMLLGLGIGALLAWRLQRGLSRLETYANQLSAGERVGPPKFRLFFEFASLATALDKMRQTLAGRAYAEHYVQSLTHELKSPLTAIQAASELLQQQLPEPERIRFAANIQQQSERLHQLIEQLLHLSALEQRQHLPDAAAIDFKDICLQALQQRQSLIEQQQWQLQLELCPAPLQGDLLLLQQAIGHLLDNALDFAPKGAVVVLRLTACSEQHHYQLMLFNQGPAIPGYALPRLTERFYSLPRPGKQHKSTGLGLNFVLEVSKLHQGELQIHNTECQGLSGVAVSLTLPERLQH